MDNLEKLHVLPNGQWELSKAKKEPIVAYHGTKSSEPFDAFKDSVSDHGPGVFVASNIDHAKNYSDNGLVAETHINADNPINSSLRGNENDFYSKWGQYLSENPSDELQGLYEKSKKGNASDITTHILQESSPVEKIKFINMLRHWGHDTIVNNDLEDESKVSHYQVLNPSKIKIHKWHKHS